MTDSVPPDQPLIAGKYRQLRPLAAGGMGALYLAEHVELETVVVVKRLLELRDSPADVARFRREAKAAAALRSRHIVRVHDFGTDEAGPYLVMERLRGQDLASVLEQRGALPVDEAVGIFRQAAKAMRIAHAAGVVHRDIKPSNLFLAEEEGELVLKVLDFGIAKRFAVREGSAAITASGMLLGSPGYMAPEQVRGQPVDVRADLWALGVVLYEMLTNAPPFYSEHVGDSLVRVCAGDYAPATSLNPGLGWGFDAFFARALAVDVEQRFQSVDVLLHGLDLVLNGATDLGRMFVSAPTLKATSGAVGSLAPPLPERESVTGPGSAAVARQAPRTLDASHVPISEPVPTGPSKSRQVAVVALVVLLAAGAVAWVARRESAETTAVNAPDPAPSGTPTAERERADATKSGVGPVITDGSTDTLPASEASQPAADTATNQNTSSVAAGTAPKPATSRPAAPTKTTTTTTSTKTPTKNTADDTAQAPTSPPPKTKSSQPKRDPFTGLVME